MLDPVKRTGYFRLDGHVNKRLKGEPLASLRPIARS
jgi:hypothetical protein